MMNNINTLLVSVLSQLFFLTSSYLLERFLRAVFLELGEPPFFNGGKGPAGCSHQEREWDASRRPEGEGTAPARQGPERGDGKPIRPPKRA
ncbi:MAG: hypothetical protein DSO04_07750 [Hadesarchaea archaeon]|nr:MAG: hypothetical protein DSO04_07750 [Hadesarchaea archaeon]